MLRTYKNKEINVYFLYTIFFIIVFLIAFLPFMLRRNGLVSEADGFNQAYPIFVYTKQWIEDLGKGEFKLFDFRIGLGDDVISSLSCHGVFDIISVVLALIFPKELSGFSYNVGMVLKYYFCGVAFIIYIKRYVNNKELCVAGALLYAINASALKQGLYFGTFITPLITLPLILTGIDDLLEKDRKYSGWMFVALFWQSINGFYFLYMDIVITVVYFIVLVVFRLYKDEKNSLKQIVEKTVIVLGNGLAGVCSGGMILFPSIYSFLISTRSGESQLAKKLFVDMGEFITNFGNLFTPNVYVSIATLSVTTVLGWIVCLGSKKIRTEFKVISIVMWILHWSPIARSILNGFSYDSTRGFGYVLFFIVAAMVIAMEEETKISKKIICIFEIIFVSSMVVHIIQNPKTIGLVIRVVSFSVLAVVFPYIWNSENKRERKLLLGSSLVAALIGLFTLGPKILGGNGYSAGFKTTEVYKEISDSINGIEEKNSDFERWDIYNSSLGASLVLDYNSATEYLSILNPYVSEFYQEMDISSGVRSASHILRGLDARKELEILLSVTQYMDYQLNDSGELESVVVENKEYLPLGFCYDSYMLRDEFDNLNPMQKESILLNTVVLEEKVEEIENYNITEKIDKDEEIEFKINENSEKLRIYPKFDDYDELVNKTGELYVQISQIEGNAELYVGNRNVQIRDKSFLYYIGKDEQWFNVTELQNDQNGYYFDIFIDGTVNFEIENVHVYWHEIDYKAIEKRRENIIQNLEVDGDYISGNISCTGNEILFFSVPYSKGWKAYVDGELVKIYKTDIGFLSILPGEGEHYIELKYVPPGFVVGMFMTAGSILFIIWLNLYESNKKRWLKRENTIIKK